MTIPPAAVIALRDLSAQWRQRADHLRGNERVNTEDVETEATLHQCADDLDALLARVEPPPSASVEQACGYVLFSQNGVVTRLNPGAQHTISPLSPRPPSQPAQEPRKS